MDSGRPVWRLEFQFRGEAISQFKLLGVLGVLDNLGGLWGYGTQTWLRLAQPVGGDSNRARWPTHPLWQRLADIRWRLVDVPLVRYFSTARIPSEDKLFRMNIALLSTFGAIHRVTDFYEARDLFNRKCQSYNLGRCMEKIGVRFEDWFEEQVRIKGRKFNTLRNHPTVRGEAETPDEVNADASAYLRDSRGA